MTARYSAGCCFNDVGLDLTADELWLIEEAEPALGPMVPRPPVFAGSIANIAAIAHPTKPELPPETRDRAERRFGHFGTECYAADGDLWLLDEGVVIHLPRGSPKATAWVHEASRGAAEGYRRALIVAVIDLFRQFGLYQLHSGCVTDGRDCILFSGGQGHGKSTATIAMALGGWACVADDMLFLRATDGGVGVQGWREYFNVGAATRDGFGLGDRTAGVRSDGRHEMDPSFLNIADDSTPVHPTHIVLTEITHAPESQLCGISRDRTLHRMVEYSPMVVAAGRKAQEHLDLLRDLTRQCECLHLRAGLDVLGGALPGLVSHYLSR